MEDDNPIQVRSMRMQPWFWIDNEIVDTYAERIGATALGVYIVLARYAGNVDQSCWPTISTIAKKVGLSRAGTKIAIKKLKTEGLISVQHRKSAKGDPTSNVYTLMPTGVGAGHVVTEGGSRSNLPPGHVVTYPPPQEVPQNAAKQGTPEDGGTAEQSIVLTRPTYISPTEEFDRETDKVSAPLGHTGDTSPIANTPKEEMVAVVASARTVNTPADPTKSGAGSTKEEASATREPAMAQKPRGGLPVRSAAAAFDDLPAEKKATALINAFREAVIERGQMPKMAGVKDVARVMVERGVTPEEVRAGTNMVLGTWTFRGRYWGMPACWDAVRSLRSIRSGKDKSVPTLMEPGLLSAAGVLDGETIVGWREMPDGSMSPVVEMRHA